MKRILLLMLAVATSVALFSQPRNSFEVSFKLDGLTAKTVFFTVMADDELVTVKNSEITPDKDGRFVVSGEAKEPVVVRLNFKGQDRIYKKPDAYSYIPSKSVFLWFIVQPGDKFEVKGSLAGKDFVDIYPKATKPNAELALLNAAWMPLANKISELTLQQTVNPGKAKVVSDSLAKEQMRLKVKVDSIRRGFLKSKIGSVASLWLLEDMYSRREITMPEAKAMLVKVTGKARNSYYFKTLEKKIAADLNVVVGKRCPAIVSDRTPDGKKISLADFKGKYVIVDFWGTWCGPCMGGMPAMKAFRDKHADKLEILGIASEQGGKRERWLATIKESGLSWFHIISGSNDQDFVTLFNVTGFPTKLLISPDGTILYRGSGESKKFYDEIEELISK